MMREGQAEIACRQRSTSSLLRKPGILSIPVVSKRYSSCSDKDRVLSGWIIAITNPFVKVPMNLVQKQEEAMPRQHHYSRSKTSADLHLAPVGVYIRRSDDGDDASFLETQPMGDPCEALVTEPAAPASIDVEQEGAETSSFRMNFDADGGLTAQYSPGEREGRPQAIANVRAFRIAGNHSASKLAATVHDSKEA
jgi:hypothetical protein